MFKKVFSLFLFLGCLASSPSFAQDLTIPQMMIENTDGALAFKAIHKNGPLFQSTQTEQISQTTTGAGPTLKVVTVTRYTLVSLDCLGTDECRGTLQWIVTGTRTSNGITYQTTYQNQFIKNQN